MRAVDQVFVDRLFEKHECGPEPVSETARRPVPVDGATLLVLFPEHLPPVEVVSTAKHGDLLFLVGRIVAPPEWGVAGNGAIIVARRTSEEQYSVHVWHELHRGALEYLVGSPAP